MLPQISATAFFCFGITVLCLGYIFVEILFGDKYFFRKSLDRNKGNLFDRTIHYIIRGLIINVVIISLSIYNGNIKIINDVFNLTEKIARSFGLGELDPIMYRVITDNIQMIIFSIWYFIATIITIVVFFFAAKLGIYLGQLFISKFFPKKKKSKKNILITSLN